MSTTQTTWRYYSKFQARFRADEATAATGIVHVVYLDSLGFVVTRDGHMERTDVAEVYRAELAR